MAMSSLAAGVGDLRRWCASLLVAASSATASGIDVDVANVASVKAAFVLNFIKYTEWPVASSPGASTLRICSPSARPLEGHLALLHGKPLRGGRTIEVRVRVDRRDWPNCQVLYLNAEDADVVDVATRTLGELPVLLVGDSAEFALRGGTIAIRTVGSRMHFDVNLATAQRAGLRLSSHMLRLAGRVIQ